MKPVQNTKKLLGIGEASEYLNVSIDTLRRWEKKGKIEALRSPGNHRYFSTGDLDKLFGKKYRHDSKKDQSEKQPIKNTANQKPVSDRILSYAPVIPPLSKPQENGIIIDRPAKDIKIPELKTIRIIQSQKNTNGETPAVSVLTPDSTKEVINENNKSGQVKKTKTVKSKLATYLLSAVAFLLLIAVIFFIIGASKQEILSPIP